MIKKFNELNKINEDYEKPHETDTAGNIDELADIVINHLEDWKNGDLYDREETNYLRDLASELQKIDVLFSRMMDY